MPYSFESKLLKIKEIELLAKMCNTVNDVNLKIGYTNATLWARNNKLTENIFKEKIKNL